MQSIGSLNGGNNEAVQHSLLSLTFFYYCVSTFSFSPSLTTCSIEGLLSFITDHIINYNTLPMQYKQTCTRLYKSNCFALSTCVITLTEFGDDFVLYLYLWQKIKQKIVLIFLAVSSSRLDYSCGDRVCCCSNCFKVQLDLPINFRFVFGWHDRLNLFFFASFSLAQKWTSTVASIRALVQQWSLSLLQLLSFFCVLSSNEHCRT